MLLDSFMSPSMDAMDTGGGGGGTGDLMSDGSTRSSGGSGQGQGGSQSQSQPQAVELSNDSYIRVPGQKDPVKYSDYIAGFVPKSDFTKKQQEAAATIRAREDALRERDQRLQALEQRQSGNAQAQTNPLEATLKNLASKPYVTGGEAAELVKNIWEGGIVNLSKAIGQRDQVIRLLYERLMGVDKTVGSLNGQSKEAAFKGRLASVKSELNLPDDPQVDEFLQDVYYSHEGEDLDREFPNLVKARWDALQKLVRVADQKRVENARKQTLNPALSSRGGNATPSKPLKQSYKSAKEIADDLWPALTAGQT